MTTFLALYRGKSISDAKMVAVSVDPELISIVADSLLDKSTCKEHDPVVGEIENGRRKALHAIKKEAANGHA